MSEDWRFQASPQFGRTMVNVRGVDAEDFLRNLDALTQHADEVMQNLGLLNAAATAVGILNNNGAVAPQGGGSQSGPQNSPAPGASPTCPHGTKEWVDSVSKAGRPYKGWKCPSGDRSNQCRFDFK